MRLKQLSVMLIMMLAVTAVTLPASGQGAVRVFVDGDPVAFDQPPVIQGSRVLVPLRGIFEKMGATVEWRPATRTVLAASGSTLVELQIGSRIARVNGSPVTLDVPAMIIGGRTLVPLRFISESLGAQVQWDAAARTVLIFSGQPPVTQPPPPPPGTTTIRGIITNVVLAQNPQDQPRVTIESGNISTTIRVTAETSISRVETSSGVGGSVGAAALRRGDDAEVTVQGDVATRIRASWTETAGRIEGIAANSRTIVLSDGRTIRYHPEITVLLNGNLQAGGVAVLRQGHFVQFRLNPSTKEAWEANIVSQATQMPGRMTLDITQPQANQTVGNPIRIVGRTAPNARVDIVVNWILGNRVGGASLTAGGQGRFATNVQINLVLPNTPYTITVTATHPQLGQEVRQFNVIVSPEAGR
jgi:hypothetical protein